MSQEKKEKIDRKDQKMRYRIIDKQNNWYLNYQPKSKKDARDYLINYHSIDVNNRWLNSMNLEKIMAEFDWDLERVC